MLLIASLVVAAVAADPAEAGRPSSELARLDYGRAPDLRAQAAEDEAPAPPPYGSRDSWRWYITGGGGLDVTKSANSFGQLGGGVSYFILEDLSVLAELQLQYYSQIGNDAIGFNWNLLLRWDFFARETWSLYADAGCGIMLSTEPVPGPEPEQPIGGHTFHFSPQLGVGISVEVAPNVRFLAGTRWYHLSNANTIAPNPPRDSLMIYAGLSMPF